MNKTLVTILGFGVDHDLILTPFLVFLNMESLTMILVTFNSFGSWPRLLMLIPWPGPHLTLVMLIFLLP